MEATVQWLSLDVSMMLPSYVKCDGGIRVSRKGGVRVYIIIREFKIAVYHTNVKPLRHNTARDPSTFHVAVAVCRSRLYV